MVITGHLNRIAITLAQDTGALTLSAVVDLHEDMLGHLDARQHLVLDATTLSSASTFIDAVVSTLTTELGITVTRPEVVP